VDPWLGLAVLSPFVVLLCVLTLMMLKSGYKLRH
jgi:uncharacterized protein (DUF983 family)